MREGCSLEALRYGEQLPPGVKGPKSEGERSIRVSSKARGKDEMVRGA